MPLMAGTGPQVRAVFALVFVIHQRIAVDLCCVDRETRVAMQSHRRTGCTKGKQRGTE